MKKKKRRRKGQVSYRSPWGSTEPGGEILGNLLDINRKGLSEEEEALGNHERGQWEGRVTGKEEIETPQGEGAEEPLGKREEG